MPLADERGASRRRAAPRRNKPTDRLRPHAVRGAIAEARAALRRARPRLDRSTMISRKSDAGPRRAAAAAARYPARSPLTEPARRRPARATSSLVAPPLPQPDASAAPPSARRSGVPAPIVHGCSAARSAVSRGPRRCDGPGGRTGTCTARPRSSRSRGRATPASYGPPSASTRRRSRPAKLVERAGAGSRSRRGARGLERAPRHLLGRRRRNASS